MPKRIVVCCDGTGNEVQGNLSNVLKLFRILDKSPLQRVFYNPGVGTVGNADKWSRLLQNTRSVFGLVTGYGLDDEILGAYSFINQNYSDGDEVYLFGFSRGAYTVRAVAGFLRLVGLLPRDQINVASYALKAYKRGSEDQNLKLGSTFGRLLGAKRIPIKFVGVWDTVASVIVPRGDRIVPSLQKLPFTRTNPSVEIFRQAMAIDERRRMFRLNRWLPDQVFKLDPFDNEVMARPQDARQVWFAGVHSDVGGGYEEAESGLSKFPLQWMITEAQKAGLTINEPLRSHLVDGKPLVSGARNYVAPDYRAKLHDSLTAGWMPLEYFPKAASLMEWDRQCFLGRYIPAGEPRLIDDAAHPPIVHESAVRRRSEVSDYKPENFPQKFSIEPM